MSTPIDYLNNAAERIAVAVTHPDETQAQTVALIAQAEATLALAQQQRIANLIAVAQMEGGPYKEVNNWTRQINDANGFYVADEDANVYLHHEIRTGLRL